MPSSSISRSAPEAADMVQLDDRVAAAVEVTDLVDAREGGLADETEIADVADVDHVIRAG